MSDIGNGQPPAGTVTMLFSDIEGSTRMLAELGDAYADVLAGQREVLRAAFGRWSGTEMGTEGDSFFVAFGSARDAVGACVEGQQGLADRSWPGGVDVRVRMGLHTGEPEPYEDGYVGMDVHLAARVAATAHGGQIVLSEATGRLVAGSLPSGTSLADLGLHRLKDIPDPQRLHQLVVTGLRHDFPALRSLGASSNLPARRTAMVGRSREQAEVTALLTSPGLRLLTVTGAGGCGKTRLAVEVADAVSGAFPAGVYFVGLAAVSEPAVVWSTIAESLGLVGESKAPQALLENLAGRRLLFVLDNLEQIPDVAQSVVTRLVDVPDGPTVLATSRRPLHVLAEQEYPLDALDLPPSGATSVAEAEASSAVALFVQRAQLVKPGFALTNNTVADIVALCRSLDGLPLALELVASRIRLLSPRALLERVDTSLALGDAAAGRPGRHQTLHATMSWSHDLLTPALQTTFRRLSVLSGGGTLEAVAAVTGVADPLDDISELTEASLVRLDDGPDGAPRVRLLQTVRRFATERAIEAGDLDDARRRHAEHFVTLAEQTAERLQGPGHLGAASLLVAELDNFRQALTWSLGMQGDTAPPPERVAVGLRLCTALGWFWYARSYVREGRQWLERASGLASAEQGPELAGLLHTLGILLAQQGRLQQSRDLLAKCLRIRRRIGDLSRVAMELNSLGVVYRGLGDPVRARQMFEESIAISREIKNGRRLAPPLSNLSMLELDQMHTERAIELLAEATDIDRARGDVWGLAAGSVNLSAAYLASGRTAEAEAVLRGMADEAVGLGDPDLSCGVLELLAVCLVHQGETARAARVLGACDALRQEADLPITGPDAELLDRLLGPGRGNVDAAVWDAEAAAGRGLTVAEALALALG